jgi:hypothetical protein
VPILCVYPYSVHTVPSQDRTDLHIIQYLHTNTLELVIHSSLESCGHYHSLQEGVR